jgi:hypothetical protein
VLVTAAAASLLLVGLLSLPGLFPRDGAAAGRSAGATTAADVTPDGPSSRVVNVLRLPGGLTFEAVETATGTQTVVAAIPQGGTTTLQVGDVLLVYAASGETLETATALRDILQREFTNGVATYGFVVRRDGRALDAEFRLGVAG